MKLSEAIAMLMALFLSTVVGLTVFEFTNNYMFTAIVCLFAGVFFTYIFLDTARNWKNIVGKK